LDKLEFINLEDNEITEIPEQLPNTRLLQVLRASPKVIDAITKKETKNDKEEDAKGSLENNPIPTEDSNSSPNLERRSRQNSAKKKTSRNRQESISKKDFPIIPTIEFPVAQAVPTEAWKDENKSPSAIPNSKSSPQSQLQFDLTPTSRSQLDTRSYRSRYSDDLVIISTEREERHKAERMVETLLQSEEMSRGIVDKGELVRGVLMLKKANQKQKLRCELKISPFVSNIMLFAY
jgi:hypothetical protein